MRTRRLLSLMVVLAAMASGASADAEPPERRAEVPGSPERTVTTSGNADGFHLLVAEAGSGYRWRTVASLSEPGFDADSWIGNACVTGSGRYAVVVYAPRVFTNRADLADRGGFTAIVDLILGEVRKLRIQTSLAYFNPGCGAAEQVVLTQGGGEDLTSTRVFELDAVGGVLAAPIEVPGQLTSPVPTAQGIVAADSGALVRVDRAGRRTVLTPTRGVPYQVTPDADGGVVFLEQADGQSAVARRAVLRGPGRAEVSLLATGGLTKLGVTAGRGGQVFVTGPKTTTEATTGTPSVTFVEGRDHGVSPTGDVAVTSVVPGGVGGPGAQRSPALPPARAAGDPNDPADGDQRVCSVARNDPRNQAMQPKPRQVEWAVDQAVRHRLTVQRPANWKNLGMPAYTPQGISPPRGLDGGGFVPAQVMLGITAQESNMWQTARFAVPGVTANPLIGNYFGIDYYNGDPADDWVIRWDKADCGYGVTQVTDGMRLAGKERPGETALPYDHQRAIALDFAANIAKGVQILQGKWNQMRQAGLVVNNGDPARIENWFFAVWAYNSGSYPDAGDGRPWGVGWLNNPANPRYPQNRTAFLEKGYADAAHPQHWPYPEKVMGWAGHPIEALETPGNLVHGYRAAWWLTSDDRAAVKPPVTQFCDASNQCEPGARHTPNAPDVIGEPAGPCAHRNGAGQFDLKCWYHQANTWKPECVTTCGNETLRFDPGYEYQEDATSYPPVCTIDALPAGALVVDNLPQSVPSVRPGCVRTPNSGTFGFTFRAAADGTFPGKIDVHQLGASFGAHFWMSNTHKDAAREAIGTWRLDRAHTGPMRIMAFIPDPGARTSVAEYRVNAAGGGRRQVIRQAGSGNRWVPIGTYMFQNVVPQVSLSSLLPADREAEPDDSRIAWDAVAFVPVAGAYHEEVVDAVGVFDENQNIDTSAPGSWLAGPLAGRQALYDWAIKSTGEILAMPPCAPGTTNDCLRTGTKSAISRWRDTVIAAGTDPVNHPPGNSIAGWIKFAQPYTDRPTTDRLPAHFDDKERYKVRTRATVSFVSDGGRVVPGSEYISYVHRTGDSHLPEFVGEFIRAVASDYGIAAPDLRYRMRDLNVHDRAFTSVDPLRDGRLPGRAYSDGGTAPLLVDSSGAPSANPTCVRALSAHGGSSGYRPMLSQAGPTKAMDDWVYRVGHHSQMALPVYQLAVDVRDTFFNDGVSPATGASVFVDAPVIWQELYFLACADGVLRPGTPNHPVLRVSYMPDQYLYRNGEAIDLSGVRTHSSAPLMRGDFYTFSNVPQTASENAYGPCPSQETRSKKGNPWEINQYTPSRPGVNPAFWRFCNLQANPDESHSNMHGALDD